MLVVFTATPACKNLIMPSPYDTICFLSITWVKQDQDAYGLHVCIRERTLPERSFWNGENNFTLCLKQERTAIMES